MVDFLTISTRTTKRGGIIEIYPKFNLLARKDLMIRGGDFYAIWLEDKGLWSTDEADAIRLIDKELDDFAERNKSHYESGYKVLHMWDSESGMIDAWHKYCQKQMRDSYHMLDEKLIFSNTPVEKKDYASKRLNYPLEPGSIDSYDKLMSTLYSDEERHKIEWAIGSIVSGESKALQKFMVLYGGPGTGKGTVIKIIKKLFDGYAATFDAKSLGSSNGTFALEAFRTNPLVAIDADGKLDKIEDNTRLNLLVSHEPVMVNEKFKSTYTNSFKAFLIVASNSAVKITDAKSGLIRRLIDVSPTGNKISSREYHSLMKRIDFELGAIACHCRDIYLDNPAYYDDYIPTAMLGASNDFYNFVLDSYFTFKNEDGTSQKVAWEMYKTYCDEARVPFPYPQRIFKEELKNYFWEYKERYLKPDGTRVRSYYHGFRADRFEEMRDDSEPVQEEPENEHILNFKAQESIFDTEFENCAAQYASTKETPVAKWDSVKTKLRDLDTKKLHYVMVPENLIVIDFDLMDSNGNKSFELNLKEASKWPPTYAELSKSGAGIHLHYYYTGDPSKLSAIYEDRIEIKVPKGNSSLRRKLTMCNDLPIATISSGLPLREEKPVVNFEGLKNDKALRTVILRSMNKEYEPHATKPSIDFIAKVLDDAYKSGMPYDVSNMHNAILNFAKNSSHNAEYCVKKVAKMQFKSEEPCETNDGPDEPLVFYDVEVFPNLFLINWKAEGEGKKVVRMINPSADEVAELCRRRLVGFNCRRYDNHILYGRMLGYDNEQLYKLSQSIINGEKNAFFREAYNLSYTDVYDFSSKKQSLKKFEIELGIHHQELGLPWDQPVPKELWEKVAEYCDNDVIATEAVFNARKGDFTAREILADITGGSVNDTTNSLSAKFVFGNEKHPQSSFNYRDMGDKSQIYDPEADLPWYGEYDEYTAFDRHGRPIFPGYTFKNGKSLYRGEDPKEGGYVFATPGMYFDIALLDIASMHPSSVIAEQLFGKYTQRFQDIKDTRVLIKHKDFEAAKKMLGGALAKYLDDESMADDLAQALKIVINAIYGLTSASFDNPFRDPRNKDNIVAKRGALFMINLKHEVQKRGFIVAHIKTDSIKIPNATPEIIKFVTDYGKLYGYIFEHEATYDRMCLVNNAVYIARYATVEKCHALYGKEYIESSKDICKENKKHPFAWTATGTQFQIPYVFKTLFSKEPIEFSDLCETKQVKTSLYLDMNESLEPVTDAEKELEKLYKNFKSGKIEQAEFDKAKDSLEKLIAIGHDYHFVGRIGQFCPIKPGCGGGLLVAERDGKYNSATGAKGYRWLESEMVRTLGKEKDIDRRYYDKLANDALDEMAKYGDVELFCSDEPFYISDTTEPWFGAGAPYEDDSSPFDKR